MTKAIIFLVLVLFPSVAPAFEGIVRDQGTDAPIAGAVATLGGAMAVSGPDGRFQLAGSGSVLYLRAAGYRRLSLELAGQNPFRLEVHLVPLKVRALYLSTYGIGHRGLREAALSLMRRIGMNSLVIDVKGDRGFIPFPVNLPMAAEVGAQRIITVRDMKALVEGLRRENIYLIARIVVFKDNLLATGRPEWAVKTVSGAPFLDNEQLHWVDPFIPGVWDYNLRIARIAAELGFDEIQFDYVRFPDRRGLRFSRPATEQSRTEAITGFLREARRELAPYNVLLGVDIFGYVLWNLDDTGVGQKVASILDSVDVVSPMLYPSGFQFGVPGYRNPVENIYKVVRLSLERARQRTGASPLRFRPWLQAFRDYAFGGGMFGEDRIREQIRAADDFGSSGWMLWNPKNVYPELHSLTGSGNERDSAKPVAGKENPGGGVAAIGGESSASVN